MLNQFAKSVLGIALIVGAMLVQSCASTTDVESTGSSIDLRPLDVPNVVSFVSLHLPNQSDIDMDPGVRKKHVVLPVQDVQRLIAILAYSEWVQVDSEPNIAFTIGGGWCDWYGEHGYTFIQVVGDTVFWVGREGVFSTSSEELVEFLQPGA